MAKSSELKREMRFTVREIPVKEMTITVHVHFSRLFKLRLWLGAQLIKILGWLWTANIEFKEE